MNDLLALSAIATTASVNPGLLNVLGITPANWQSRGEAMVSMSHRASTPTQAKDAVGDGGVTVVDDFVSRWKTKI